MCDWTELNATRIQNQSAKKDTLHQWLFSSLHCKHVTPFKDNANASDDEYEKKKKEEKKEEGRVAHLQISICS